jgi:nitroimidazol reductase NimA-like FMN-containing flavoprotein (pyridoxamine 5'-phosphate oxidase superfamily)
MVIREMSTEECVVVLAGTQLARLACARNNQPYVVPVYLTYHEPFAGEACFYGYTSFGQKAEWMRTNPLVCVEVDEVASWNRWTSVIAYGRYEELPTIPEQNIGHSPARQAVDDRNAIVPDELVQFTETRLAHQLLQARAMWWEPAATARAASAHRGAINSFVPIFYKVSIDRVTGHEATPDTDQASSSVPPISPVGTFGRLRRALLRVCPAVVRFPNAASRAQLSAIPDGRRMTNRQGLAESATGNPLTRSTNSVTC